MSALLAESAVSEPTLAAGVCGLLAALTRGAKADDSLHVHAKAGNVFGFSTAMNVPVREVSSLWVPAMVLRCLEERASMPWRVSLSSMRGRASLDPATISAVACWWKIDKVYDNPSRPGHEYGKQWIWPHARLREILARLESSEAPPTMVIEGLPTMVALWALDQPVAVADSAAQARALLLLRALAAKLGADVFDKDARLADLAIPLPGVAAANQAQDIVEVPAFHSERIYSLKDIEAAIAAKKAK